MAVLLVGSTAVLKLLVLLLESLGLVLLCEVVDLLGLRHSLRRVETVAVSIPTLIQRCVFAVWPG